MISDLPAAMQHMIGYHFGWWDERGRPLEGHGGKAIRPALTLLAAEAVGGDPVTAVPAAVAVELVHNFSLLHDDVMDADATRRHRPTTWRVFGNNAAILAGDTLLTLAFGVLGRSTVSVHRLHAAVQDLLGGQSADMAFERRADVALSECRNMATAKTGALLSCSCALGAALGGGGSAQIEHLGRFGEQMGLAFQFVDDLLGIWGDPAVTGKPVYSDLRNRKKSLPVVAALTSGTAAGDELGRLYHREQPFCDSDLIHAAELIDLAGGRAWSRAEADRLLAEALKHLQSAGLSVRPAAELEALARLITQRDH
ncbi:family 2 encapsulin nanocompartment cargo protein polyprenyl transferase [Actinomadura alba]